MDFELVKLEIDGEIATLTFNDPDNLNAMNQTMLDSLDLALDHVEDADNNIRLDTDRRRTRLLRRRKYGARPGRRRRRNEQPHGRSRRGT